MNEFKWTGERLVTNIENQLKVEHLHRYAFALQYVKERIVLDIACGEGYGVNLLANLAKHVYGVDIDRQVIAHARTKYNKANIEFVIGPATAIPLNDSSVDVVTSFETLEHLDDHDAMMTEIKRVLKPDGILIISTPDKKIYSEELGIKNEFHVKELYFNEFNEIIAKRFANHFILRQKLLFGSFIIPPSKASGFIQYYGDYDNIKEEIDSLIKPLYNICIASDLRKKISSPIPVTVFNDDNLLNLLLSQAEDRYKKSYSYRLGYILLWPFKFLYRLF